MSVTYNLCCHNCQEKLWVGQTSQGNWTFYSGDPKVMELLGEFLFDHQDHDLGLHNDEVFQNYEEILT